MSKILLVDDEEHIHYLYSEELEDNGYEVINMENGYMILEMIQEEKPDIVVLDIKMVDYNGLDLLQDIRNKFYDLPVILCSAYDTFKENMKSIAADFYVVKSFDLTELKNKIAMALEATDCWGKGIGNLSLSEIKQRLKRLLNMQSDPTLAIDRVPGYAALKEELSTAGFSQEKLDEIEVVFKEMCNDFNRENRKMTEFISDWLLNNYKKESKEFTDAMRERPYCGNLISLDRSWKLYKMEEGKLLEKIHFLSGQLCAAEEGFRQGRLSKKMKDFLAEYAQVEHRTLAELMRRWRKKLKKKDINGVPINALVKAFNPSSTDSAVPEKIQNVMLKEARHDLKNVTSSFILMYRKVPQQGIPENTLDALNEIRNRPTTFFDRLSEESEVDYNTRLKKMADELDDLTSRFTIHLKKLWKDEIFEKTLDALGKIRTRLTALVERLREISVFSAKPRNENLHLNYFMESLLEDLGIRKGPGITIQIDPQAEEINTDARVLGIALRQVLQNAIEAVGSDGKIKIAVRPEAMERPLRFTIEDDGPGIPENLLKEVFKPGFGYRKMGQGHSGMGLALCKEALKEIGGKILIHSMLGKGTTIEIRLYQE